MQAPSTALVVSCHAGLQHGDCVAEHAGVCLVFAARLASLGSCKDGPFSLCHGDQWAVEVLFLPLPQKKFP